MIRKNVLILTFLSALTLWSCKDKERGVEEMEPQERAEAFEEDLEELREDDGVVVEIEGNPELSTFAEGLNAWNIGEELNDANGPFTVFAPSNTAYSLMYRDQGREVLHVNNDVIIQYHIVEGNMTADQLKQEVESANGDLQLDTMSGEKLTVSLEGDKIILKDSSGDKATITGSSASDYGVVHTIDKVLLPTNLEVEITAEN